MRVVHQQGDLLDQHFYEGEPELEAPEEMAVDELDEDVVFEEDLDFEVVAEDDVDLGRLEETLDAMVHACDDDPADDPGSDPEELRCRSCLQIRHRAEMADPVSAICLRCAG